MPQIRQYTREVMPTQLVRTQATPAAFGGDTSGLRAQAGAMRDVAGALGEVGAAAEKFKRTFEEKKAKQDTSTYISEFSQFQSDAMNREKELSEQDYPDDTDLGATYASDLMELASGYEERIPESMRGRFQSDLAQMQLSAQRKGMKVQAQRRGARDKLNYQNTLQSQLNIIDLNPDAAGNSISTMQELVNTMSGSSEDKALLMDEARDTMRNSQAVAMVSSQPQRLLDEIEDGKWSDVSDVGKIKTMAEKTIKANEREAETALKKQVELSQIENQSKLMGVINSEEMPVNKKLQMINKMELTQGIKGDFAADARRYINSLEKRPVVSSVEQTGKFLELNERLNVIKLNAGDELKISHDVFSEYRAFQGDVLQAASKGLISQDESEAFLKKYSATLLEAISTNSREKLGLGIFWGVQDPYGVAFKEIDAYLKDAGQERNLALKKELMLSFDSYLGDFEPSSSTKKDKEKIDLALIAAKEAVAKKQNPSLQHYQGDLPNTVLNNALSPVRSGGNAIKNAKEQIKRDFAVKTGKDGRQYKIYQDGSFEVIQ